MTMPIPYSQGVQIVRIRGGTWLMANMTTRPKPKRTACRVTIAISCPEALYNTANPKAIPGATVGYQVVVTNNGTVTADNVEVIDTIPANAAFLVGSVTTVPAAVVSYSNDGGTTWVYGPVAGANGTDPAVTGIRVVYLSVAGAANAQENFQVLID